MVVVVKSELQTVDIPEIAETVAEKSLSIGQLKYQNLYYAKQHFQGKIFVNKITQKPVRVSKEGLMEWWKKSRKREQIIAIKLLDWFLENARLVKEMPDYKNRQKIISASQFECRCIIEGKPFQVTLTTRKAINDIDKFKYCAVSACQ